MTDALNTAGDFAYIYPPFEVYLSTDGDPPADEDRELDLHCRKIVRAAGSSLDYADLAWGLTGPLSNRTQPAQFARSAEVRLQDGSPTLLRGDYVFEQHTIEPTTESLTAQVQVRSYHFGTTCGGMPHWDPETDANVTVMDGPLFNPLVDGKTLPNMSEKELDAESGALIWVDAESVQTNAGETYHDTEATSWTLKQAVYTMCWLCNPDEEHIKNPTLTELAVLDGAPEIRNLRLPLGQYLPAYLDALLQPLGFNWFLKIVEETVEEVTSSNPTIAVFKRGAGTEKELLLQPAGEVVDPLESNVNSLQISNRIGDSVNEIEVLGAFEVLEITIPLYRGWLELYDDLENDDLDKSTGASYPDRKAVWRDWVANEGGDYTDVRTDIPGPPDLSSVFGTGDYVPRRRVADDPLTFLSAVTRERHPVLIEYSTNAGSSWTKISDADASAVALLPNQIGIRFTGDKPPAVIQDAGADARVRITVSVQSDKRIRGFAERQSTAVNGRVVRQTILAESRFQFRYRIGTGSFASVLTGTADERDDVAAIQDYAEALRDQYEVAEIAATFEMPGIHLDYEIGDLLTKVAGRELSLNMAAPLATARYPQITGIAYEMGPKGPRTVLTVDRGQTGVR